MARGGKREGAGRKPKDPAEKARAQEALSNARRAIYDPALCDEVMKTMADGYSLGAFAGKIGVSRSTINQWMSDYPDFSDAVSRAKCSRLVHWEDAAMQVAKRGGGPGTATIIVFGLRNMGAEDWSDKQVVEHTGKDGEAIKTESTTRLDFSALTQADRDGLRGILSRSVTQSGGRSKGT